MHNCPCCGDALPISAMPGELCPKCENAMLSGGEFSQELTPERQAVPSAPYPVTKILLLVNVAVFTAMTIAHSGELQWGANFGPYSIGGQWWRLLTSAFIHFNASHLVDNSVGLWLLGKRAERLLGRWIFLSFYLTCGIAASLTSLALNPEKISAGASGAIFGLAGGLISAYALRGLALPKQARWKLGLLVAWAAVSVYPSPGLDNAAHVGGLITGLVLGAIITLGSQRSLRTTLVFASIGGLFLAGGFIIHHINGYVIGLADVYRGLDHRQPDHGLQRLRAVLRQKPDSVLANVMAADAYYMQGNYHEAELAVRRALQTDPGSDHARYVLGMVELKTGRCDEAKDLAYNEIHSKTWNETASLINEKCNYAAAGKRYFAEHQIDEAIDAYQKAIAADPNNAQARLGLAEAHQAKELVHQAHAAEQPGMLKQEKQLTKTEPGRSATNKQSP